MTVVTSRDEHEFLIILVIVVTGGFHENGTYTNTSVMATRKG